MQRVWTLSVLAWASALSGCSLVTDVDRTQCATDGDCVALGFAAGVCGPDGYCDEPESAESATGGDPGAGDPGADAGVPPDLQLGAGVAERWQCLEEVSAEVTTVAVTLSVYDVALGVTLADVPAKLCGLVGDCSTPLEELVSDENGVLSLEVDSDFNGYLEISHTGYLPHLYFFPRPAVPSGELPRVVLFSTALVESQTESFGTEIDMERGFIYVGLRDCDGVAPGDVVVSASPSDESTEIAYILDVPIPSLESTQEGHGSAILSNVPVGYVAISLQDSFGGEQPPDFAAEGTGGEMPMGAALELLTFSAQARAGYITQVQVVGSLMDTTETTPVE